MKNWISGRFVVALFCVSSCFAGVGSANAAEPETVTISGNAWAFVLSGTTSGLEGATVRVAEYPDLQTTSGPDGSWSLEVPNNASITPYATAPDRYPVHDQTFFTRGKDLNQVNFQMPPQSIAEAFAVVVGAGMSGNTGSKVLNECAIVSTVYQKEGRSFFDFDEFLGFAPHGVVGSTAELFDENGQSLGEPMYFNSSVIPDPNQDGASNDGGMVWDSLPAGTYTVRASHPTARFSEFQATCEPGRLVNASPPWGLYELHRNEEPNPAVLPAPPVEPDARLDAFVTRSDVSKSGAKKRKLTVTIRTLESVTAEITGTQGKRRIKSGKRTIGAGTRTVSVAVPAAFKPGSLKVQVRLKDSAGNSATQSSSLSVPAIRKRG